MTTLLETAHRIAEELGAGWRAERGYMIRAHVLLHGPDTETLTILDGDDSHRRTDHGRLHISADYGELGSHLNSGEGHDRITVASHRSAAEVAAEITRRLLPDYTTTLGLCRTRARAHARQQARQRATRDALCEALTPARLRGDDHIDFGEYDDGIHGDVRVLYSGPTEFTLSVASAYALELAQFIAARRTDDSRPK
ncbi:hypothetical protein ACFYO1_03195 [Nocardia sp. NPDC006044]|uniref:hypothetical protein n=1 Tax=Nocardia sp. NPDC006044 TaxID=3364306 RepID=UPI003679CFA8